MNALERGRVGVSTTDPDPVGRLTRAGVIFIIGAWVVVAAYASHALLPAPVIDLPGPGPREVGTLLPQGWAFFTKDVREDRLTVLHESGGSWKPVRWGPTSRPEYAFGAQRAARTRLGEITAVATRIPDGAWRECDRSWSACVEGARPVSLTNDVARPSWCGRVALVSHEPVPWAWAAEVDEQAMPARGTTLDIACG